MDKFLSVQPGFSVYHPNFGSRISLNKISYWLSLKTPESKIQKRSWSCAGSQKKHPLLYFQAGPGPPQSPGDDGPQGPGGRESKAVHLKHMVRSGHRSLSDQPALYVAVSELWGGKRGLRWWERKTEPGRNQKTVAKVSKGSVYWEIEFFNFEKKRESYYMLI